MIIERRKDVIVFRELNSFLSELLMRLTSSADPSDRASRSRVFGTLTAGRDPEADAEWREINEPELRELFKSHLDVVADDLKDLTGEEDEEREILIPADHLPAWVHTLNQARLAIAARHNFTEEDMEGKAVPEEPAKIFALLQVEAYGEILAILLHHTEL